MSTAEEDDVTVAPCCTLPTVVIVEHDRTMRAELAEAVAVHPELALVGVGGSELDGVALCAHHLPDVAVVDLVSSHTDQVAIEAIHEVSPRTAIVGYGRRSAVDIGELKRAAQAVAAYVEGDADTLANSLVAVREPPADAR